MSDALTTLQNAIAPKIAMRRINFATQSAELDSFRETPERLVNLYAEQAPANALSTVMLRSPPGLLAVHSVGDGPIRAMNGDLPGRLYVVSGSKLIRITDTDVVEMGDVGSPSVAYQNTVTIAVGPLQVVVCVPPRAYAASVFDTTFYQLQGTTDNPFPGASSVAYIDGYFVFTADGNSTKFFSTGLFDPSAEDPLDFAMAEAVPNVIRRVVSHLDRLWFMGESAVEVWYDSGDADFPFRREAGGMIPRGVCSPRSVAVGDGSVWWIGTDGIVYRSNGYAAVRVSTHAIENAIWRYDPSGAWALSVADAFCFTDSGHTFYAFTLLKAPDLGRTFVYDCATKLWHERSTSGDGNARWRVGSAALSGNVVLGDHLSGKLYTLNPAGDLDDDFNSARIAISPPIWNGTRRAFMDRLEVEMEAGNNPVLLDWSDDGGATWKGGRTIPDGSRVATDRLGSFHERVLRLTTTGRVRIYAVDAQITPGAA